MSDQTTPLSENQVNAATSTLADELDIPERTIAWISAAIDSLAARKPPNSPHSSAREVCSALLRDLNEFYTGDIEDGLRQMQLYRSEDIGRVVWGLVSKQVIYASPNDSISQFDGLFRVDDLDRFLAAEGIQRKYFSLAKCKYYASRTFYIFGITIIVAAAYAHLVPFEVEWFGWVIVVVGFVLSHFPDPKRKRF